MKIETQKAVLAVANATRDTLIKLDNAALIPPARQQLQALSVAVIRLEQAIAREQTAIEADQINPDQTISKLVTAVSELTACVDTVLDRVEKLEKKP